MLNGSLHLSSVQHGKGERSDEGVYQCVATLPSVGTMLSRSAKLQTTSLRPFELEPKDVVVRVGDVARFNCYVHVRLDKKIYSKERKNLKKKKASASLLHQRIAKQDFRSSTKRDFCLVF